MIKSMKFEAKNLKELGEMTMREMTMEEMEEVTGGNNDKQKKQYIEELVYNIQKLFY